MTAPNIREAHKLLDTLFDHSELSHAQIDLIRGLVPELPKQKTVEELAESVFDAWAASCFNEWGGAGDGSGMTLEEWLKELHDQLDGLVDVKPAKPVAVPALPAGMRLADHEQYGRVVTVPKPDQNGVYTLLISKPKVETVADWGYAHECELTFVDAEPAHPEFLETEGDYYAAPEGTVVVTPGRLPWVKEGGRDWSCSGGINSDNAMAKSGRRSVLRWGWGNE